MRLEISPLTPGDRPDWQDLWTDYLAFYETSVPAEVYDTTFHRLCADDVPRQNGLIARQDGQAVGLVHYIYHPHNWKIEEVCYLQDLYADPSARGMGVGRKLIEAVYSAADRDGRLRGVGADRVDQRIDLRVDALVKRPALLLLQGPGTDGRGQCAGTEPGRG